MRPWPVGRKSGAVAFGFWTGLATASGEAKGARYSLEAKSQRNSFSDNSLCRLRGRDVSTDGVPNARTRGLDGFVRQMGISCGRLDQGVTEQLPDHGRALAEGQGAGRKAVP